MRTHLSALLFLVTSSGALHAQTAPSSAQTETPSSERAAPPKAEPISTESVPEAEEMPPSKVVGAPYSQAPPQLIAPEDGQEPHPADQAKPVDAPVPAPVAAVQPLPCAPPPPPAFTTLLLLEASLKYGGVTQGSDLLNEEIAGQQETYRAGYFGGQATLGIMPSGKSFVMGGRLRGGAYVGNNRGLASMGASMLFGANFGKKADGKNFSYALGGLGVEFLPTESQDMLSAHASAGTVINGMSFGGGFDVAVNDEVAVFVFGMNIGWGSLL